MGSLVLVVDDEPLILSSLTAVLRSEGFDVVAAATGRDALDSARRRPPDAVLLDLVLGDMDGLDVLRALHPVGKPAPPVLLITAHGSVDNANAAARAGACDFLRKPFEMDDIVAALRRALAAPVPPLPAVARRG